MDRKEIEAARKAGILDNAKADELNLFLRAQNDPGASSDNESLRFLANFNDVFISIGLVLLAIGLSMGSGMILGSTGSALVVALPVLITLWLMLEYFAGRRRLLLPSMTLSVLVTGLATILVALIASGFGDVDNIQSNFLERGISSAKDFGFWASAGAIGAAGVIYARFRLPFALFLIAIGFAVGLYTYTLSDYNFSEILGGSASFVIGMITLAVAIFFDAQDPERKGLNSDNAFWLHFAAAPQIMLGLRGMLTGGGFTPAGAGEAATLLLALGAFAFLSLAINRRALIAAALLSFWLALGVLVESAGGSGTSTAVWTLVLLGGAIVLLGAGWKTARRMVLAVLPRKGPLARIFPPEPA